MLYIIRGLPGSGRSAFARSLGLPVLNTDAVYQQQGINPLARMDAFVLRYKDCVMFGRFPSARIVRRYMALAHKAQVIHLVSILLHEPRTRAEKDMRNAMEPIDGEVFYWANLRDGSITPVPNTHIIDPYREFYSPQGRHQWT